MKKYFEKFIEIVLIILIISIFFEVKGIFNIGVGILGLSSIIKVLKKRKWNRELLLYLYFGGIFIGIFTNLINGTLKDYFSNERSLFYVLIFIFLNFKIEQYEKIKNYIIIGGIIPAIYSGISYFTPKFLGIKTLHDEYKATGNRMQSFANVIRWGSLLQVLNTFLLVKLTERKNKISIAFTVLLGAVFLFALMINGTRAGMVGLFGALLFLIVSLTMIYRKKALKPLLMLLTICLLFVSFVFYKNPIIKDRAFSIGSITNHSNKVRLDLYKIGFDIIKESPLQGHGSEKIDETFEKFIKQQSTEYLEKNYNNSIKTGSGTPFENNYINLAVENGLIYVLYMNFILLLIFIKILKKVKFMENRKKIKILIVLSTVLGQKIFVFFFPGTDSYVEFLMVFLLFYSMELIKKEN